jgi:hypothetical protein
MRLIRIASIALACGAAAYALPATPVAWGESHDFRGRQERICADEKFAEHLADRQRRRADQLAEQLNLTEAQKAAFKETQVARAKNATDARAVLCAAKQTEMSFDKRLEFRQARLQARLDAMKAENPKLLAFYNSLDEKQKGRFDEISRRERGDRHGMRQERDSRDRDWKDRDRDWKDRDGDRRDHHGYRDDRGGDRRFDRDDDDN